MWVKERSAISIYRYFYIFLGGLFLCLGVVGIVLPLLPTTPFLLLASACFMRGSPKFYRWLHQHPYFGSILQNWYQHGAVSKQVKRRGAIVILLSFSISVFLVPYWGLKIMLLVLLVVLLTWFLRLPTHELVANTSENH